MATTTRTPKGTATLLGIYKGEGHHCDDCSRELAARRFEVRTAEGEVRILGRKCAALATGYPTTRLEHQAAHAERTRAWEVEVAATWTAEQLADHYREVIICYPDDTLDAYEGDGIGTVRVPVAEHAITWLARFRERHGVTA